MAVRGMGGRKVAAGALVCSAACCLLLVLSSRHHSSLLVPSSSSLHAGSSAVSLLNTASCAHGGLCGVPLSIGDLNLDRSHAEQGSEGEGEGNLSGVVDGRFVSGKVTYKKQPGVFIPAGRKTRRRQQRPTIPGVDSEYQKAISNLVSNLRTRQRGVSKEAQNIAKGVTSMFTSDSVTQSIANLALGIAEARAREEDGNEFLGKAAVSPTSLHASKSPRGRTGEDWRDATSVWRKQGIMNDQFRQDVKHASRLDPSSGLTQMELKTVEENPASGASGPEAGEYSESSCAACLVCPGCCENGWVPGCKGALMLQNVTMAARISDALNYVIDPKDASGIDQRLSSQYQSTLSSFLASRMASEQRAAEAKMQDNQHYQEIMKDRKRRLLKRKIREQERKARMLPLESIAASSSAPLTDPWSQYYAFQGVLGSEPTGGKEENKTGENEEKASSVEEGKEEEGKEEEK